MLDRIGPRLAKRMPRRTSPDPSLWNLVSREGSLFLDGVELASLTHRFGSPLHVVDLSALRRRAKIVQLSDGTVFVDRRRTVVGGVLAELHRSGVGITVNGVHELETTLAAGVGAASVLWADPVPTAATLAVACREAVGIACVPTLSAMETLLVEAAASTQVGLTVPLAASDPGEFAGGSDAIATAFELCRSNGREAVAVRFEIGGEISSTSDLEAACRRLDAVARSVDALRRRAGSETSDRLGVLHAIVVADVLPPTVTSTGVIEGRLNRAFAVDLRAPDLDDATTLEASAAAFESTMRTALGSNTRVSFEPGSALVASTQMTLSTVLDAKRDGRTEHVVLDAGMNLAAGTATHLHELFNVSAHSAADSGDRPFRFVGPICTPADVTYTNWRMGSADIGDVVAIMDTGAGFVAASTSFSFPQPAVVSILGGEVSMLRDAESFQRLTQLDELSSFRPNGAMNE